MTGPIILSMSIAYLYGWWRYSQHWAREHMQQWARENAWIVTSTEPECVSLTNNRMREYTRDGIQHGILWPLHIIRDRINASLDHSFHPDIFERRERQQQADHYRTLAADFLANAAEADRMNNPDLAVSQREIANQFLKLAKELDK